MTDHVRQLVGIEALNKGSERWTGKDELVAVIDSGIDATHPDLSSSVQTAEAVAGGTVTDLVGHGTHVAGTIAGSGAASKGQIRGMAPDAKLISLGIVDESNGKDLHLPPDLADLLRQVAAHGAKIINLSWGKPLGSLYESGSMAIDTFAREKPDVLIVVAAGNSGEATTENGYPSLYSIGAPATAKNVLTVGACLSDRNEFANVTWGSYAPRRFSTAPTKEQLLAGDPRLPAALSSRGPTDSDSIKPDLLAPGTAILAPRATQAPADRFWKLHPPFDERYAFMNGTSMATPVVSGAAAVVRQYLREEHKLANPSSALLRAILVAASLRVPWARGSEEERDFGFPDFDQGFGRLDLSTVLPHEGGPQKRAIGLIDVPNEHDDALERGAPEGATHGAIHSYGVTVPAGTKAPLRIVLAWTDYSVRGTQNVLGLDVQGPKLRKRGNEEHAWLRPQNKYLNPKLQRLLFDGRNTVQQVVIDEPAAGAYHIRVNAHNTLFPPQGFALCVCGEFEGQLERES